MLRKDYIMRQFEEFGKVMAVIFSLKKEKDWDNFEKEITQASLKFTSLKIIHLETITLPEFGKETSSLLPDQQKILADLLYEKMNYYFEINNETNALNLKSKCYYLYKKYSENLTQNEFNLDVHYKLEILGR